MLLKTLRQHFYAALEDEYQETEILSFFNLLSECFLKMKGYEIPLNLYSSISGKKADKFENAIKRLKKHEPIQYIIGTTEFFGLPFHVNASTLIPRPETEELVQWILESTANSGVKTILDIGTGTGCIAVSLAKNKPESTIHAIDVSIKALAVAKTNAKINNVTLEFKELDILNWKHIEYSELFNIEQFDVIVSNPPYVRALEKAEMSANVLNHEPAIALYVEDNDPLIFYKAITNFAAKHLKIGGFLFFEINQYLGQNMIQLLETQNFTDIELKKDIFGNDRMITGVKSY